LYIGKDLGVSTPAGSASCADRGGSIWKGAPIRGVIARRGIVTGPPPSFLVEPRKIQNPRARVRIDFHSIKNRHAGKCWRAYRRGTRGMGKLTKKSRKEFGRYGPES